MERAVVVCCLCEVVQADNGVLSQSRCHSEPAGPVAAALLLSSLKEQRCSVLAVSSGFLPMETSPHVIVNAASQSLDKERRVGIISGSLFLVFG